jgi:hypothetical protein
MEVLMAFLTEKQFEKENFIHYLQLKMVKLCKKHGKMQMMRTLK